MHHSPQTLTQLFYDAKVVWYTDKKTYLSQRNISLLLFERTISFNIFVVYFTNNAGFLSAKSSSFLHIMMKAVWNCEIIISGR